MDLYPVTHDEIMARLVGRAVDLETRVLGVTAISAHEEVL